MELHLLLVFGVFLAVLNLTLSQLGNNTIGDVDGGGYLLSTSRGLYYKKEDAMYTLYVHENAFTLYENFDYHYAKGLAFFQTYTDIVSMPLMSNRPPVTTVIRPNESAYEVLTDFAVDWVHDRIIYSFNKYDHSRRNKLQTLASTYLQGGDNKMIIRAPYSEISVKNLAVDPIAGKLFWSNTFSISSCNLNGSDYKIVLVNEKNNEDFATALTLDLSRRRIFYVVSMSTGRTGSYFLNSVDYDGGQIMTGLCNFDKVTGNTRREIISVDSLQERLLLFSALYDQTKSENETFVMESLYNGTVEEGKVMLSGEKELEGLPILDARFVHRGLQPSSDPTVK